MRHRPQLAHDDGLEPLQKRPSVGGTVGADRLITLLGLLLALACMQAAG